VLLTTDELASRLGEESRTISTWRQRGIIPFIDAGYRTKRYKLDDVLRALAKRTIREV
jgi:Helix-turn-helix domain